MCCMEDFSIYGCAQCSLADCRLWTRLGHTRVKTSACALPYEILPAIKGTIDGDRQRGRRAHKSMTTDRLRSRESAGPPTSCPCRRDATTATSCYSWPSSALRPFPPRRRPAAPGWRSRPLFNTSQTAASAAAAVAATEVNGARWIFSFWGRGQPASPGTTANAGLEDDGPNSRLKKTTGPGAKSRPDQHTRGNRMHRHVKTTTSKL